MCMYIYIYMCAHLSVYLFTRICIYIYIYIYIHTHAYPPPGAVLLQPVSYLRIGTKVDPQKYPRSFGFQLQYRGAQRLPHPRWSKYPICLDPGSKNH